MKIGSIYAIGSIALVLGFCGIGWFVFQPKDMESMKVYKTVTPEGLTAQTTQPEEEPLSLEERAEQGKARALESFRIIRGTHTDPFIEKMQKAMESPAYQEYLKKQDEKPGFNIVLWWDFLESQGVGSSRKQQETNFREFFPTGEYADYEPDMRKKIAELALEYPEKDTGDLLGMFWADRANSVWSRGYFNGYEGDFVWADNIRQNAGSILTELTPADVTPVSPSALPADSTSEPNPINIPKENGTTSPAEREDTLSREKQEQVSQFVETLQTEFTKDLFSDISDLPTNTDFETALREQFSPQRFNTALQTLTQYGPEDGLRRLKESDPELATHIERLIRSNKETD